VETLPVAEVVPVVVASERPATSSSVAAATSLIKIASAAVDTAVVAAAPVVSAPVAVVAAPGAAVNTPIVAPAPVVAASAAMVETVASPAPVVEMSSAAAAAASEPIAAAPESIVEPIQHPELTVETLPVANVVPAVVVSEGPVVNSPVAATTSHGKTAVVAVAPVVSAPVAVVEAPGAAVNTPIVAPVPVVAAPAAVVEPVASPVPVVEVASAAPGPIAGAAAEPIAAATPVAVDLPVPAADPVVDAHSEAEVPVSTSPLPATASTAGIESPPTELAAVPSTAPALSLPEGTEVSGVPFAAISATAPVPGLEVITLSASPEIAPGPAVQAPPAVTEESIEAVVYRKFRLQEVTFGTNQWKVSQEGMAALAMVAEQLRKENKEFLLRVDGHTDSLGSDNYNDKLSLQRSITIATNMVVHNGFDPARLFVKGFGEGKPIAPNDSAEGKAKNRRVEILVLLPKKVPVQ
jgi:outer membrane protein OmpA-like peptidoglycan-associated protein